MAGLLASNTIPGIGLLAQLPKLLAQIMQPTATQPGGLLAGQTPLIPPQQTPPVPAASKGDSWMQSPLFQAGLGLLASGGPSTTPNNPWSGILGGMNNSHQMQQQIREQQARDQIAQAQMGQLERQDRKDAEAERLRVEKLAQVEEVIRNMKDAPPELIAMMRANPDVVLQQMAQSMFPGSTSEGAEIAQYKLAQSQGYKGSLVDFKKEFIRGGGDPYFTPVQASTGFLRFNNRTGAYDPVLDSEGKPLLPVAADVGLAGAKAQAEGAGTMTGQSSAKRQFNMSGLNEIIQSADDILSGKSGTTPTASGFGAVVDTAVGFVGASPSGAKEAEQLKAIGGALVAKMPRMEGPQSDRDTMMYREMAGQIGDRTIPIARRRAALEVVKQIWGKYEGPITAQPGTVDPRVMQDLGQPKRFVWDGAQLQEAR